MTDESLAQKVAKLARIEFIPDENNNSEQFDSQFDSIIQYIGQIQAVDIADEIEPFFGATEQTNATRDDIVNESFSREQMLSLAPKTDGEFYRVPPVFES